MTDLLSWSWDLGRWRGIRVRLHFVLLFLLIQTPLFALLAPDRQVGRALTQMAIFLAALAVHELGLIVASYLSRIEPEDIMLGPFGNMVPPMQSFRPRENAWLCAGGILANAFVAFNCAVFLSFRGAMMVFNPFGNPVDAGAPLLLAMKTTTHAAPFSTLWFVGWFGWLNWVLFLLNMIPALPLDGGRLLRTIIAQSTIHPRDSMIAPITARACAALLALAGVFRLFNGQIGDFLTLAILAAVIELTVRLEARLHDEGGEFETGAFGYDFSEGFKSFDGGSATVRPRRESALHRWRRRRSELRRLRREAQEAAEERRLDEILEKLHQKGKASLSNEENKFLLRVSSRIRNKSKSGG